MKLSIYQKKYDFWFLALLILFLFKPSPTQALGASMGMKITDILYILMFVAFFSNYKLKLCDRPMLLLLASLFFLEVISLLKGLFFHDVLASDVLEVTRPLLFLLAFSFGCSLAFYGSTIKYKKLVYLILLFYIIFSLAIFMDFYGFKGSVSALYEVGKSRGYSDANIYNIWRLSSTFTNPNYFGLSCSIIASFLLYRVLNYYNIFEVFILFVFILFVLLSGSRTALLSLAVVFIFVIFFDLYFYGIKTQKRLYGYMVLLVLVFSVLIPKLIIVTTDMLWRFSNTSNIEQSFMTRVDAWTIALISIEEHFLLGVGSNKSEVQSLDNNFVMILYKNGMLGLILIIVVFMSAFRLCYKILNKRKMSPINLVANNVSVLLLCSTAVLIIGMFAATPLYMSQLSLPYFILFGYVSGIKKVVDHV